MRSVEEKVRSREERTAEESHLAFSHFFRTFRPVIDTSEKLTAFLPRLQAAEWIALDTEADSLHAYTEKLCLVQISIAGMDELVDPLAGLKLAPLFEIL